MKIKQNYRKFTDKYFLRGKQILEAEGINPIVRYQVFARKDINALKGVDEAVDFIKSVAGDKVKVYALKDGDKYKAKEPIMKLEGRVQDLIELETVYLEILSGNLTGKVDLKEVRRNARAIKKAAGDKPVYYFGARHFHYDLDEKISKICQEEGFAGCSTDVGGKAWNEEGMGTIPHALILAYAAHMHSNKIKGNATAEAAKAFDKYIDKKVPRINLIDTFNKEITDSLETYQALEGRLAGVRIDTCGENCAQGGDIFIPNLDVPKKYLKSNGVTIPAVWSLRAKLDPFGHKDLSIVVSSGFNAEKTKAFMKADKKYQELFGTPLFNSIGTGSLAKPIMTTSDIVAYYNEDKKEWIPMSKKGRDEIQSKRLKEVKK